MQVTAPSGKVVAVVPYDAGEVVTMQGRNYAGGGHATLTHHGHNTNVHFCFSNAGAEGEHVRFALASGIHVNYTSDVIRTEHPKPIQVEVKKMEEAVREIHEEMLLTRTREHHELRDVNEGTNARIMHSSALTRSSHD
jgi:hypothetical protein